MEPTNQQKSQLTGLELSFNQYFRSQIRPVMAEVRRDLNIRQAEETAEYLKTPSGILSMCNPNLLGPMQADMTLQLTGEWNSKTTEDYLSMCQDRIQGSPCISKDLNVLTDEWRKEIIGIIGREAYDGKSKTLGEDLASAYVNYRMEGQMLSYLIDEKTPKSSLEYILKKGTQESLLGFLSDTLSRSEVDSYISEEAEKAYGPTIIEKGAGKVFAFGTDIATTGGMGGWCSLGKLALAEVAVEGGMALYEHLQDTPEKPVSVEEYISRGVLGSEENILGQIQEESKRLFVDNNAYARTLDEKLDGRLSLMDEEHARWLYPDIDYSLGMRSETEPEEEIHIPYLPGFDPAHPEKYYQEHPEALPQKAEAEQEMKILEEETPFRQPSQSTDGWGQMLSATGLDGLENVGKNLGYVISMLPDVLVGIFTGRSKHLAIKDNLLPIASVLAGLFVKNPLLKMVLIGMGGMNLMNKAGKEALGDKMMADGITPPDNIQYKSYPDQPLDPRMDNPEIRGNSLLATVDGVPCTIQLPEQTVAAYRAGALPLNTLANAVLAKSDEMNRLAQNNFEQSEGRSSHHALGI